MPRHGERVQRLWLLVYDWQSSRHNSDMPIKYRLQTLLNHIGLPDAARFKQRGKLLDLVKRVNTWLPRARRITISFPDSTHAVLWLAPQKPKVRRRLFEEVQEEPRSRLTGSLDDVLAEMLGRKADE